MIWSRVSHSCHASNTDPVKRVYGPDDRLTYAEVHTHFADLTPRFLRHQYRLGNIDAFHGPKNALLFRFGDLLLLRESLRVSYKPRRNK